MADFTRSAEVVRKTMNGHKPRVWTSDRYSAQQRHGTLHQTCLAHLAAAPRGEPRLTRSRGRFATDSASTRRRLIPPHPGDQRKCSAKALPSADLSVLPMRYKF